MNQPRSDHRMPASSRPVVRYRPGGDLDEILADPGTLAVMTFGDALPLRVDDPRVLNVPLQPAASSQSSCLEHWHVDDHVESGRDAGLAWASSNHWLFAALDLDEADHGSIEDSAELAYAQLCGFLDRRPQRHVQRLWNYLGSINQGHGDDERYRQFCAGRQRGMGHFFDNGYPAATAIGHHQATTRMQVYCLASTLPGTRVENPRQLSAWRYPRQYGPTPPSFARAMRLPGDASMAISGTASITGHDSRHEGDLEAQLGETLANLKALLKSNHQPEHFGPGDPLKIYVRHPEHVARAEAFFDEHTPVSPRIILNGDICRSELLVEIDGWRFA
ncbi:pteridine-dependent deoxygenase [Oleiagrimonas sp.]|jgi:chorismate lyase/3-hydroxybenzoate synthase|uniref:chorismate transformation enzyme, FkbO/Hyg5 family n=1 Tax=Oleiagrimonas sp. TaxID=2010330 RepID=UPI002629F33C|nr:pteridine-dependent deoxygenase [Oleiagrimonas sp.]MDA3913482.1 pteridine-dependent deoxygenase [Oleiagrimonas sp.]